MRAVAEQWGSRSRVGLSALILAMAAWLLVGHPGVADAAKKSKAAKHATTVHVVEHAVTDTEVPSGGGADVTGNVLTFHNQVFNPADTKPVGTDLGSCIRISPAEGSWECSWTTMLTGGQLMVQGPYYDTKNSVLAITGGTGAFRHARGEMKLVSRNGGKEYDFIFRLS